MSIYGIVSDIHFHEWSAFADKAGGTNSRLAQQVSELIRAASAVIDAGGQRLYVAGDTFHVRGSISTEVLNAVIAAFDKIVRMGVEVRAIPGNHDLSTRDSRWNSSAISALYSVGVNCVVDPTMFADDNMLMIPWLESVKDMRDYLIKMGENMPGTNVIMHAPLNGVIRGIPPHGLEPLAMQQYGLGNIFSGHYHNHVNFNDRVFSVGSLTHQTWSDVGTQAGFLLVEDDRVTHLPTQAPLFVDFDPALPDAVQGNYLRYKTKVAKQSEVAKYRAALEALGAAGVVIHAVPDDKQTTQRSATVAAGASLQQSIADYIETLTGVDKQALSAYCLQILGEVA